MSGQDTDMANFNEFRVGQTLTFARSFDQDIHELFLKLTQDDNPLHWSNDYAQQSRYEKPIVPLHILIAPFSYVVGVYFPGTPALYLGHEVRALKPVFYGDSLIYSARITRVNSVHRALEVRVLVIRGSEVVVDATLRTKSRSSEWKGQISHRPQDSNPVAVVTGAVGALGSALAKALIERNFDLVLIHRNPKEPAQKLQEALLLRANALGQTNTVTLVEMDLEGKISNSRMTEIPRPPQLLIHAASPAPRSALTNLISVNYTSLRDLVDFWLPDWLSSQEGTVINVSSTATIKSVDGWEDYSAAKSMSANFVASLNSRFENFGIRGVNIILGRLLSDFTGEPVDPEEPSLAPEEAALMILERVLDEKGSGSIILSPNDQIRLSELKKVDRDSSSDDGDYSAQGVSSTLERPIAEEVIEIIKTKFRLKSSTEAREASMGSVHSWDSLSHIELILLLEERFSLTFGSEDIYRLTSTSSIIETVAELKTRDSRE